MPRRSLPLSICPLSICPLSASHRPRIGLASEINKGHNGGGEKKNEKHEEKTKKEERRMKEGQRKKEEGRIDSPGHFLSEVRAVASHEREAESPASRSCLETVGVSERTFFFSRSCSVSNISREGSQCECYVVRILVTIGRHRGRAS